MHCQVEMVLVRRVYRLINVFNHNLLAPECWRRCLVSALPCVHPIEVFLAVLKLCLNLLKIRILLLVFHVSLRLQIELLIFESIGLL